MELETIEHAAEQVQAQVQDLLLGNSLIDWGIALGVLVATLTVIGIVKWLLINRLSAFAKRTSMYYDDAVIATIRSTRLWLLFFPALYFASRWLEIPDLGTRILKITGTIGFFVQIGLWLSTLTAELVDNSRRKAMSNNSAAATSLSAVGFVGKLIVWAIVLLLALDNLGIDVTALVAGLGVGGIAVALAVQNVLGDLFASLAIIIDKPFELGDFIIVDDYMGSVEHIGLKTTRVRSLGGEQIIFSNADLLGARVRNYKRMLERRIVFAFGVTYQTPPEQLRNIPGIVKEALDGCEEQARLDRAHFFKFGDSSLDFEVVYWMKTPDYNAYMDVQQKINLFLMERFASLEIDFAYPTRTLYVESSASDPDAPENDAGHEAPAQAPSA